MDKAEEKRWFEAVMPREWVAAAIPDESPDFICYDEQGPFIGVEVTELFTSHSEARLHKIPNYVVDILDSGNYRHPDDRSQLPVKPVTFHLDGGDCTVPALVRQEPPMVTSIKTLAAAIEKKSGKLTRYKEKVVATDLLLVDRGELFNRMKFEHAARIVHESEVRSAIQRSGFREIWLVINTDPKVISIPCRVNLLAERLATFHAALGEVRKGTDCRVSIRDYLEMLGAYLAHRGFVDSRVMAGNDKYAVFTHGVGCFVLNRKLGLFAITPRVTHQSELGNGVRIYEPRASHPLFDSLCRVGEERSWFVNIVETPAIQF
jgi:hypothetical protein